MNTILNRLAWICAIFLGSEIFSLLFIFSDSDLLGCFYSTGTGKFFNLFLLVIFSLIAKRLFLSKKFIDDGLSQFEAARQAKTAEPTKAKEPIKTDPLVKKTIAEAGTIPVPETAPYQRTPTPIEQVEEKKVEPVTVAKEDLPKPAPKPTVEKPLPAQPPKTPLPPVPRKPNAIDKFFSENLLAKVGGILLFLGVLFLLKLVYTAIGPVGKLSIGFAIGFSVYAVGLILDKKSLVTESRVLIGTGILINYLVILSGRYLIGDGTFTDQMILNEGITFFLLIGNTALAVVTSLLYRSYTLLFFSFVIAFLNPFLIGADASSTPHTLLGYGMIVSLGALVLYWMLRKETSLLTEHLLSVSFIGGNLLFLVAPFSTSGNWLFKLAAIAILTHLVIYTGYKTGQNRKLGLYFIGGYLFLSALLIYGNIELMHGFRAGSLVAGYLFFLLIMLLSGVAAFMASSALLIYASLALPLLILLGAASSGLLMPGYLAYILVATLILYLGIFAVIGGKLIAAFQYLFFGAIGLFTCLIGLLLHPLATELLIHDSSLLFSSTGVALAVVISAFLFQFSSYYYSGRNGLQYLYSMGTVISILILLLTIHGAVDEDKSLTALNLCSLVGFLLLNVLWPFIGRSILESKIRNLIIGLVAGVLFTTGEIYYFGELYFSGLMLGLAFLLQAILYFCLGYAMYIKLKTKSVSMARDVVYAMLGISISLFSLAIAFVFSRHSEVVSAVWLFEAGLIFFFYSRDKDLKLYGAAIILMAIGIWKMVELVFQVESGEFLSLVPLTVIFGAFVTFLKFLETEERPLRWVHDSLHLVGMGLIGLLLMKIIPSHGHGFSVFGGAIGLFVLANVYVRISSYRLRQVFVGVWVLFFGFQTLAQTWLDEALRFDDVHYLIVLQYLATALTGWGVVVYNRFLSRIETEESGLITITLRWLNAAFGIYLFVITTLYVFFGSGQNIFFITIYWGILTFAILNYGILNNAIKWRTLGLYILILTVSKILLYDVWQAIDDAVYRILALMMVGAIMIVISILYQKRYDGNLINELNIDNLK